MVAEDPEIAEQRHRRTVRLRLRSVIVGIVQWTAALDEAVDLGGGETGDRGVEGELDLEIEREQVPELDRLAVVVLKDCVTETKEVRWASNSSTSLAKSASERVRRSTL
jgi:hypothetical protein